jgi:hypothetical protein
LHFWYRRKDLMRKLTTALAIAGTLALTAVALRAVTFGEPDGNRHPYVGTLLFETPSGLYSCSGTLLSPTVVLTAGHCTEEGGVVNLGTWVKFTPRITFPGIGGYPGSSTLVAGNWQLEADLYCPPRPRCGARVAPVPSFSTRRVFML